jgi:hypothetical protein
MGTERLAETLPSGFRHKWFDCCANAVLQTLYLSAGTEA